MKRVLRYLPPPWLWTIYDLLAGVSNTPAAAGFWRRVLEQRPEYEESLVGGEYLS